MIYLGESKLEGENQANKKSYYMNRYFCGNKRRFMIEYFCKVDIASNEGLASGLHYS